MPEAGSFVLHRLFGSVMMFGIIYFFDICVSQFVQRIACHDVIELRSYFNFLSRFSKFLEL